jgi:hypothetical protein
VHHVLIRNRPSYSYKTWPNTMAGRLSPRPGTLGEVYLLGCGQLGQVHCPFGQLQVPEDEQPQSLMVKVGLSFFVSFDSIRSAKDGL